MGSKEKKSYSHYQLKLEKHLVFGLLIVFNLLLSNIYFSLLSKHA